jgi:hypothetical protein
LFDLGDLSRADSLFVFWSLLAKNPLKRDKQRMDTIIEEMDVVTPGGQGTNVQTIRKQLGGPTGRRLNSTGTMIVGDTLSCPNNELTIAAVAERLQSYIRDSTLGVNALKSPPKDERAKKARSAKISPSPTKCENLPPKGDMMNPGTTEIPSAEVAAIPSVDQIARYLREIFRTAQCSVDCTIVCLIYIERLMQTSGLQLTVRNWRSLIAIAMLLASKVHDDLSMINADFACFLPFTVEQINAWERQFLAGIKYDVRVSAGHYTKYYFDLREKAIRHFAGELNGDIGALDVERAQRLEVLSSKIQKRIDELGQVDRRNTSKLRRAVSDQYCPSHQTLQNEPGLPDAPAIGGLTTLL